jgi:hypothetical protein
MWGQADIQKLVQMLTSLGIPSNGTVFLSGGASRPASPQLYQLFIDTTLGTHGKPIYAAQITPTVVWADFTGTVV